MTLDDEQGPPAAAGVALSPSAATAGMALLAEQWLNAGMPHNDLLAQAATAALTTLCNEAINRTTRCEHNASEASSQLAAAMSLLSVLDAIGGLKELGYEENAPPAIKRQRYERALRRVSVVAVGEQGGRAPPP